MANLDLIQKRFNETRKIFGHSDEITTASGVKIRGRYLLTESGAVTPSHDPMNGFQKSIGFPTDAYGNTVNDRDYERDKDAQEITRQIADNYDSRALNSQVVVSKDGVVLSGNGRTMAGMIAAQNNTDAAYIGYLEMFPQKYGFQPEDVKSFKHPRLIFRVDDNYPYTAETFAMFNAQEIKSQSKTEMAVKLGKLVDDATFHRLIKVINSFDTIGEFYNDVKATREAVNDLSKVGIISKMQYPEMFDGDTISQAAREILENVLIGKAFATNPDAVRQITAFKGVRKNIITALAEISNNIALDDYSLESEMSQAINLCYQARANGCMHQGDIVSGFARQMTLFGDSVTVADFNNATVMMLADMINHSQVTKLKKVYAIYNRQAHDSANGQTDMFSDGSVKSKQDILNEVNTLLNYGTKSEINNALSLSTEQRKSDAVEAIREDVYSCESNQRIDTICYVSENETQTCNGVMVGGIAGLQLPCGDVIAVKLERLSKGTAGIRTKGWNRYRVSEELIVPCSEKKPTLPEWFKAGTKLSSGLTIESIDRTYVLLSDGNVYKHIDVLLACSPEKDVAEAA